MCTSIYDRKFLDACFTCLVSSLILSLSVINCGSSLDISIYVFAKCSRILSTDRGALTFDKLALMKMGWPAFLLSRFSINLNQFLVLVFVFRTILQLCWFETMTCNLNFLTCKMFKAGAETPKERSGPTNRHNIKVVPPSANWISYINSPLDKISSSHQLSAASRSEEDGWMWRQTHQTLIWLLGVLTYQQRCIQRSSWDNLSILS